MYFFDTVYGYCILRLAFSTQPTKSMGRTDAMVKVETSILQYAVVLNTHILVAVYLVEQAQTLWVPDSQRRQVSVVASHIYPHVVLMHKRKLRGISDKVPGAKFRVSCCAPVSL